MVLNHIAQCSRFFVIAPARAYTELFAYGQLDVVDRLAAPELLEDRVRKAEHQDVLHRFLPQVVVDSKDLFFVGEPGQLRV
jgi:hypothetical protein